MAHIDANLAFDPDTEARLRKVTVVAVAAALGPGWADSDWHAHESGQLLYLAKGSVRLEYGDSSALLPPGRVAWIAPRQLHRTRMSEATAYRALYFTTSPACLPSSGVAFRGACPLLREVLERLAHAPFDTDWHAGPQARLLQVVLDEIAQASEETLALRQPHSKRLVQWLAAVKAGDVPPPLARAALQLALSPKTVTRAFRSETGMGYQQWRQQWRLLKAMELLLAQVPGKEVAFRLQFSSEASFITFFKGQTGQTPGAFLRAGRPASP
jgi:AraC-like DNA-binding protein